MKNRLLYILLLLGLCGQEVSAAGIDGPARREIGRTLTRIVAREVSGGYVRIEGVDASRKRVRIYTSVGLSYYPFREENLRAMRDSVRLLLPPEFRKAAIELYSDKREVGELIPMACRTGAEYRKLLRKKKIVPFTNRSERPLVTRSSAPVVPSQGLAGRHIALWQSHGRYFDQPQNRWKWQRSQLWQTCEDLYTQSYVLPYLVPMLENAGACVMLPRERDVQKYEILADNDAAGQYREEEGPEKWQPGGMGFAHVQQVYTTGQNPFRDGTTRRVRSVTGGAESRAVWTADIPERGEYAVYVSYDSTPQNADDAQYTVHHLGGDSSFAVNQTMGGGTWIYLGRFLLDAGSQEVVTLTNRSRQAGREDRRRLRQHSPHGVRFAAPARHGVPFGDERLSPFLRGRPLLAPVGRIRRKGLLPEGEPGRLQGRLHVARPLGQCPDGRFGADARQRRAAHSGRYGAGVPLRCGRAAQ